MAKIHAMLHPFEPTRDDPFDSIKAAHLLNRAGFGGTPAEIEKVLKLGPAKAVDWLLDFSDASAEEQSEEDVPDLSAIDGYPRNFRETQKMLQAGKTQEEKKLLRQQFRRANQEAVMETSAWWLKRMARGPHPLQEKLTLFWHGHFTTSARDERSAWLMWQQNELLRRQAAGNFKEFVRAISRDPAMLDYLNNQQNRKKHPNENYARELMELFTLGIGHYTENDVKEGARAFTGWGHDGDDFIFRKAQHDDDEKVFLGKRGNFDGDDVIDIILAHPACAPYIGTKLFRAFAYEEVDDALSQSLGEILRQSQYELRPLLRTILASRTFYDAKAIGSQIKSPIQLVVGTVRLLGSEMPQGKLITGALNQMGQVPLMPPNVKGWAGGRMWINTSTLFVRYNTAVTLAGGGGGQKQGKTRPQQNIAGFPVQAGGNAQQVVDTWVARLIQRPIEPEKRRILIDAVGAMATETSIRKMIHLIVAMPEYQLC